VTVAAPRAEAIAGGKAAAPKISTPLWLHWVIVARAHAAEARAHAGGQPRTAEFHAAMVAVAASAFAVDGLYGALKQLHLA